MSVTPSVRVAVGVAETVVVAVAVPEEVRVLVGEPVAVPDGEFVGDVERVGPPVWAVAVGQLPVPEVVGYTVGVAPECEGVGQLGEFEAEGSLVFVG